MFLGQFVCLVDEMGRLELPAKFAEHLRSGAFVTQGFDHDLMVLPSESFSQFAAQISTLSKTDPLARLLTRLVLGNASALHLDDAGRVTLPQALREFCGIAGQAVVVGAGDLFEIWSPSAWETQKLHLQDAQSNADRFAGLNLALAA